MSLLSHQEQAIVAGERRLLCPDLNMAAVLHERVGEHWLLWLAERWLGEPIREKGKVVGRRLAPTKPAELALVLYALLQTDREMAAERGEARQETEHAIRRSITLANLQETQATVARAILQCFVTPGEGQELDVRADGAALGSDRARTHGSGHQSSR